MTVIEHDINQPLNSTLNIELNSGQAFDVTDIATEITNRRAVLIRGDEEVQLDASLIVVDKNLDSPTGQYNVLLELANIQDAATNTVQVLEHDNKVKLSATVVTPDGSRTWFRTFDIDDPNAGRPVRFELVSPQVLRPTDDFFSLPPILMRAVTPDGSVFDSSSNAVVFNTSIVYRDGNILGATFPYQPSPQFDGLTVDIGRALVESTGTSSMTDQEGEDVTPELLDGDLVQITYRVAGAALQSFTIPVEAEARFGPRVF